MTRFFLEEIVGIAQQLGGAAPALGRDEHAIAYADKCPAEAWRLRRRGHNGVATGSVAQGSGRVNANMCRGAGFLTSGLVAGGVYRSPDDGG